DGGLSGRHDLAVAGQRGVVQGLPAPAGGERGEFDPAAAEARVEAAVARVVAHVAEGSPVGVEVGLAREENPAVWLYYQGLPGGVLAGWADRSEAKPTARDGARRRSVGVEPGDG